MSAAVQPGPVVPDEFEAFAEAVAWGFHDETTPEHLEHVAPCSDPGDSL
jgi:hypothetical protein